MMMTPQRVSCVHVIETFRPGQDNKPMHHSVVVGKLTPNGKENGYDDQNDAYHAAHDGLNKGGRCA